MIFTLMYIHEIFWKMLQAINVVEIISYSKSEN